MKVNYYRKYLLTFCFLLFFLFSCLAAFNYLMDGANLFYRAKRFEEKLTKSLLNKNNILVCTNYDERSTQRLMLEKLQKPPQILILGSSRSMPITHDLFNTSSFYNASVPGASLEDDIALYYVVSRQHWKPDTIVINLDPWLLYSYEKTWRSSLLSEFHLGKSLITGEVAKISYTDRLGSLFEKYTSLFSSSYLINSAKNINAIHNTIYRGLPSDNIIINPDAADFNKFQNCYFKLSDGARLPTRYEESIHDKYMGVLNLKQGLHLTPPDMEYMKMFEQFVRYLVNEHINIIFYMPAYHPTAYAEIANDPQFKTLSQTENYFHFIAKKYQIKIIGAYNPNVSHLVADEFVDQTHLKKRGVDHSFKHSKHTDLQTNEVGLTGSF